MRYQKPRPPGHMIERSRQLRRDSTNAERLLWNALRGRHHAGLKFRRQQAVGPFVADFFCVSAQVVIELNGETHEGNEWQDEDRQKYLEAQGLKVLRFTNERLLADPEGVLREIVEVCLARSRAMEGTLTRDFSRSEKSRPLPRER